MSKNEKMSDPKYSVVLPVYNSEKSLIELCERIKNIFENTIKDTFEIIMVDDCSVDNSWEIMNDLQSTDSRIKII